MTDQEATRDLGVYYVQNVQDEQIKSKNIALPTPASYSLPFAASQSQIDLEQTATLELHAAPPAAHKSNTFGRILLSSLLSILLFAFAAAVVALAAVCPNSIAIAISRVDIAWLLEEAGISEEIVDDIKHQFSQFDTSRVDIGSISAFLERENVRNETQTVAMRYIEAIKDGDFSYHITAREIIGFIRAVAPDIRDEFSIRLSGDDFAR